MALVHGLDYLQLARPEADLWCSRAAWAASAVPQAPAPITATLAMALLLVRAPSQPGSARFVFSPVSFAALQSASAPWRGLPTGTAVGTARLEKPLAPWPGIRVLTME